VSGIVSDFKNNLQGSDIDSVRELAVEAKKQGFALSDLAPHIRLHNFIRKSGAAEEKVESFIDNINSSNSPPERIIELVNELFNISTSESIPLDQVPSYINKKLEEKQKIDEQIKEADATLQSKNVNIETLNEHIRLNEKLNEYNLSFRDIDKLVNVLINVKENGYDGEKIVARLRKIKRLQNKEEKLKHHCEILSTQVKECNNVLPLAQKIRAMNIGINELLVFDNAVNQIAKQYNLPPSVAALRLLNEIRDYDKIGGMKRQISRLSQQLIVVDGICTNRNKAMRAVLNLQSRGISEHKILQLNNFLEDNAYKASSYISTK
jgi:vacuolar-type H+-ATPase subunit I/STV1